jgi:hypothetical protein
LRVRQYYQRRRYHLLEAAEITARD